MKPIRTSLAAVATLAVATLLAACSSGSSAGGAGTAAAAPAEADVTVTAADMVFTESTVTASGVAGEAFAMTFVNEDAVPHNVAIYTDSSKSEKLFEGEIVTDTTIVYEIPALEAGEYYFICSVHPDMEGTLVVEG